jgi:hypothetical protein
MSARSMWSAAVAFVATGVVLLFSGCAASGGSRKPQTISMPVSLGWYNGERVYYITTDITDPPMARGAGVNLALRMRDAVPTYPKPPEQKDVLERVYKFPNGEQDAVFASIPNPVGPLRSDAHYSPLWLLYTVRTTDGKNSDLLSSEEAILAAQVSGKVTVTRTAIVINCPIVGAERGGLLPGMRLGY